MSDNAHLLSLRPNGIWLEMTGDGALWCVLSATRFVQKRSTWHCDKCSVTHCVFFLWLFSCSSFFSQRFAIFSRPIPGNYSAILTASIFFFFFLILSCPMTIISQQVCCVFIQTLPDARAHWAPLLLAPPSHRCNNATKPPESPLNARPKQMNCTPCWHLEEIRAEKVFCLHFQFVQRLLKCKRGFRDVKKETLTISLRHETC